METVGSLTIQAQIFEAAVGEVVLHDCHERGHLTEEQHFVVCGSQLGEDSVQHLELPRSAVQVGPDGETGRWVTESGCGGVGVTVGLIGGVRT